MEVFYRKSPPARREGQTRGSSSFQCRLMEVSPPAPSLASPVSSVVLHVYLTIMGVPPFSVHIPLDETVASLARTVELRTEYARLVLHVGAMNVCFTSQSIVLCFHIDLKSQRSMCGTRACVVCRLFGCTVQFLCSFARLPPGFAVHASDFANLSSFSFSM